MAAQALDSRPGTYRFFPASGSSAPGSVSSSDVTERARRLGFCAVGFTGPEALDPSRDHLERWLSRGFHGQMRYMRTPNRESPRTLLPEAQTVIVVALPAPLSTGEDSVAGYAQGHDYHGVIRTKLFALAQHCADLRGAPVVARPCVDTAPLLERALAARAGVGFQGKSTLTIVPGAGSRVLLGELLVDLVLPSDKPHAGDCGQCTQCLTACPTGAFAGPYVLDSRRCISYLTIEYEGTIPLDLRKGIGTRIFGCDVCQQVCPYNASRKLPPSAPELGTSRHWPPLWELLELGTSQYKKLIAGTALRRIRHRCFQRNVAIALGNALTDAGLVPLASALHRNPSALVRAHAAWALGQYESARARSHLADALDVETDAAVRAEIALALRAGARRQP